MRQEGCGNAKRAEQIRIDFRLQLLVIQVLAGPELDMHLNSGVIDDAIQLGKSFDDTAGDRADRLRFCDLNHEMFHTDTSLADFLESILAAAGDNDLIPSLMACLGQATTDAGCASSNENRIAVHLHEVSPSADILCSRRNLYCLVA